MQLEAPFTCEVVCIVVLPAVCETIRQTETVEQSPFGFLSVSISSKPSQSGGNHDDPGDIAFGVFRRFQCIVLDEA